ACPCIGRVLLKLETPPDRHLLQAGRSIVVRSWLRSCNEWRCPTPCHALPRHGELIKRSAPMYRLVRSGELQPSPEGTVTFEGESYGSGVSCYLVNNEPGAGPNLHMHPYTETWIVRSGRARITADGEEFEAGAGDIVVVSAQTPHKFKNIGSDRLDVLCIHASPRFIHEWLEP